MVKSSERRHQRRKTIDLNVFVAPTETTLQKVAVRDLSLTGINISLPQYPLHNDQLITLYFDTRTSHYPLEQAVRARVVHTSKDAIGLRFEHFGNEVIGVLHELLKDAKYF